MFVFLVLHFLKFFKKFDIEISPAHPRVKDHSVMKKTDILQKEQPTRGIASRENYSRDRPHTKEIDNLHCDSEDLKALTRSGQRLAATASFWLDKSDWQ